MTSTGARPCGVGVGGGTTSKVVHMRLRAVCVPGLHDGYSLLPTKYCVQCQLPARHHQSAQLCINIHARAHLVQTTHGR